jgi:hypothetical protein
VARPGPTNTGVPTGTKLTPSGSLKVKKNGEIVENLDVSGQIRIMADNVTVKNCRIKAGTSASAYPAHVASSEYTGTVFEDCEIDGNGVSSVAAGLKNITLRRCNIHNGIDLVRADGNVLIEDNWLHNPARTPGSHNDAIQMLKGSNVIIRRNTIDMYVEGATPAEDDPHNACFIISAGDSGGPVDNVVIEDNWIEGGNYGMYLGSGGTYPVTNVKVRRNTFAKGKFRYGPVTAVADTAGFDKATNVYEDGTPVR